MNFDSHPVLHYILELLCFNVGLLANVLTAAHLSASSSNNGVRTLKDYFMLRWIPLSTRWVACLFLFLMVWENPAIPIHNALDNLMDGYLSAHLGTSGFVGFGCDEIAAKVTALLGMQRELPPVPPATGG